MRLYRLRMEYGKTAPGHVCITGTASPRVSWALATDTDEKQSAYRLTVKSRETVKWDSGWVKTSDQSATVDGSALEAGEAYTLSLSVRDEKQNESRALEQEFCPGALTDWPAVWLTENEKREGAVISFVKDYSFEGEIASACAFVSGIGYHKVYINAAGLYISPMEPAYSEFEKRCYYTVLPNLEKVLTKGINRIGIEVAAGWRSPDSICYKLVGRVAAYVGPTQLSAAIRVRYADGRVMWYCTDDTWQYFYGPTVYSDIFLGETFEATRIQKNWCMPRTKIAGLKPAKLTGAPGGVMQPQTLEPVCEQEIYPAVSVQPVAEGVYGADFGQNIAGVCRIRIPRDIKAGTVIKISHMEFLDEDGRLFLPQLRNAASVDTYVAAGGGTDPEYWQPQYTYHGFRYAEVAGYPGALLKDDIQAVSLYTDISSGSRFACGDPMVEKIHKIVIQTEKANIHSVLTDCPQRDERMGWMNDATVRFEETPYNFDIGRIFPKVVRDLMDVQDDLGSITCTAPFAFGARPADPVCSSFLIAGWQAYLHTGNTDILKEGYEAFKAWNHYLESKSEDFIVQYSYYGDWAGPAYACQSEEYAVSKETPGILMSTGYFYYNSMLLANIAQVIGETVEAQVHLQKAEAIRKAFLAKWWDEKTGKVATGSQGCQSFALWLDILPEEGRQKAADLLHRDLEEKEYRFTTGNLCTRYMMDALTRYGYLEDAWALVTSDGYPSIGFMIQNEATTVWERFELKKNCLMNSHNHPMYGAVGYWFYAYLAGLKPLMAGWREFSFAPYLPKGLLSSSTTVETPFGDIAARWVRRYGATHLYLTVPHGTQAHVTFPWGKAEVAGPGFHHWSKQDDL